MSFILPKITNCHDDDDEQASHVEEMIRSKETLFFGKSLYRNFRNDAEHYPFFASLPSDEGEIYAGLTQEIFSWPTVDHYLLAAMFTNSESQEYVRRLTIQQLKNHIVEEIGYVNQERWETHRDNFLRYALECKFSQHYSLRLQLLQTDTNRLVDAEEASNKLLQIRSDSNVLGKSLMDVRQSLGRS